MMIYRGVNLPAQIRLPVNQRGYIETQEGRVIGMTTLTETAGK